MKIVLEISKYIYFLLSRSKNLRVDIKRPTSLLQKFLEGKKTDCEHDAVGTRYDHGSDFKEQRGSQGS